MAMAETNSAQVLCLLRNQDNEWQAKNVFGSMKSRDAYFYDWLLFEKGAHHVWIKVLGFNGRVSKAELSLLRIDPFSNMLKKIVTAFEISSRGHNNSHWKGCRYEKHQTYI
jgi:hypothetical protein